MTEFSGEAGRMSNNQFPEETDDERSVTYPSDDDTTADDTAAEDRATAQVPTQGPDDSAE
jgi:hypothetical protein